MNWAMKKNPVGFIPNTGQPIKSEAVAISASYADLSIFSAAVIPSAESRQHSERQTA
jgi:hypothetical protein